MKHTPGPWRASIFRRFSGTEIPTIYGAQGVEVGQALCMEDARLIAAAPDLLAALLHVMPHVGTNYSGKQRYDILATARAAIEKATGEKHEA